MKGQRGMALIQALVIVAAVAAVAAALMQQAHRATLRLQARATADQAGLYLDGGVELVRELLGGLPPGTTVHGGQAWAQPRTGLQIDRGRLAYVVEDLNARLNVNDLNGTSPQHQQARQAFLRLATAQGLTRLTAERMADALGADPVARLRAAEGASPLPLPLADPRQLAPMAGNRRDAFEDLLPFLAARPPGSMMNVNTLLPEVWQAYVPQLGDRPLAALTRYLAAAPVAATAELLVWAEETQSLELAQAMAALPLGVASTRFVARFEARLDTTVLRRSVVLDRGAPDGRVVVIQSVPETE